jgi:hypothetical protein
MSKIFILSVFSSYVVNFFGSGFWCVVYTLWINTLYNVYSRVKNPSWTLGPKGSPETSVRNYHYSLHNSPEQCSSPLPNTNCSSFTSFKLGGSNLFWKGLPIYKFTWRHAERNRNSNFKLRRHLLRTIPFAAVGCLLFTDAGDGQNTVEGPDGAATSPTVLQAGNINEAI